MAIKSMFGLARTREGCRDRLGKDGAWKFWSVFHFVLGVRIEIWIVRVEVGGKA